jgi:hypothetical protein
MTGSSPIRILTVDDHPVVRDGIDRWFDVSQLGLKYSF